MTDIRRVAEPDAVSPDDGAAVTVRFTWAGQPYTLQLPPGTARALERHLAAPTSTAA